MSGLKAQDYAAVRDWPGYYGQMVGRPPRDTLLEALALFEKERQGDAAAPKWGVDLGCGEGRDTLELLRRGWHVVAVDDCPVAFDLLLPRVPDELRPRLATEVCGFTTVPWSKLGEVDLINASYALPFCAPAEFAAAWEGIVRAIRPGGRFAGQFFGDRDDWAALPDRSHHRRAELDRLLADFLIENLREVENDEPSGDPVRPAKHWHIFHVVARKRLSGANVGP